MATTREARWLDPDEDRTWRSVWTLMTWLPVRLDVQLRADAGMSLAEYNALSQMSEAPDRTLRLSDLAAATNMTLSHLSRVISRMETSGWVTRSPDPADGRYTLGHLTDTGWEKVVAVAPGHVEAVRRYVFDTLGAEQAAALGDAAAHIAAAVAPPRPQRG
ncbi:MarR family winged helix-turn-helix transcriptional regulator [Georgenia sp. SYP-B2076]|uniref:MarR family winged helix-turn-helix transcriptional regulator n=1 Tax=Georgenia sp. SYP-B2076 TaxID=2495881 RepID=UPI000F8F720E|nr:MarR family transcriptional regulator [Georgenia sp. SYP-B2076]